MVFCRVVYFRVFHENKENCICSVNVAATRLFEKILQGKIFPKISLLTKPSLSLVFNVLVKRETNIILFRTSYIGECVGHPPPAALPSLLLGPFLKFCLLCWKFSRIRSILVGAKSWSKRERGKLMEIWNQRRGGQCAAQYKISPLENALILCPYPPSSSSSSSPLSYKLPTLRFKEREKEED